jgi:uncharacterized membrane protein YhaH (DUF805 family)
MFRTISIIGFAAVFLGIGACCAVFPCCKECRWTPLAILKRASHLLTMQRLSPVGIIRRLVYLLAILCFLIAVITGFYSALVLNESIHGYWLILHAVFAPVFVICLAVLAVMWAGNCSLSENIRPTLQKACFWLIIILVIPVILSIVLSMFSLFGTQGQEFLLQVHRYSALLLALIVIVHTYLIIRTRMKQ